MDFARSALFLIKVVASLVFVSLIRVAVHAVLYVLCSCPNDDMEGQPSVQLVLLHDNKDGFAKFNVSQIFRYTVYLTAVVTVPLSTPTPTFPPYYMYLCIPTFMHCPSTIL